MISPLNSRYFADAHLVVLYFRTLIRLAAFPLNPSWYPIERKHPMHVASATPAISSGYVNYLEFAKSPIPISSAHGFPKKS
jgi:hypothetical protein